ncbi:GAF domain-containing protein [bacterium]|nr:GAF domain-containing protein [bacterium]
MHDSGFFHIRLDERLSRQELEEIVATLLRLDHFLGRIDDLPRLLELIITEAEKLLCATASSLLLIDPATGELCFEVVRGPAAAKLLGTRVPSGEGICGRVARTRQSEIVTDVAHDPNFYAKADQETKFTTRSMLASPMVRKGELIGVLEVINKVDREPFNAHDQRILEAIADLAAIAIENARLLEENVRKERLAAVGQAMAGLAHYIKNILTGLSSSAAVIDHALEAGDHEMLTRAWKTLKASNEKVAGLVADLLSYSAPRRPKLSPVRFDAEVARLVDSMQARAAKLGVTLSYHPPDSPMWVVTDPVPLERCVLNLLVNALDALEEMALSEEHPRPGRLEVRLTKSENNAAILDVEDNGPGIPPAIQARIWEIFYSTKGSRGSGIGLAVTQKFMRELGGQVRLERTGPEGTCFRLSLPGVSAVCPTPLQEAQA